MARLPKVLATVGIACALFSGFGVQTAANASAAPVMKYSPGAYSQDVIKAVENSSLIKDYLAAQGADTPENRAQIASMINDTSVIRALEELYLQGEITPPGVNNKSSLNKFNLSGKPSITTQGGLRCPAAWAALYAWAAAHSGTCAAFGLGGPWAAFGCWVVMTGISGLVDFNDACK